MVNNNLINVNMNNSSVLSQRVDQKKSVIAFLAQIPAYEWNGQKVFILKECCEKVGYSNTTKFKELIKDNTDGIIELNGKEECKSFYEAISTMYSPFVTNLTLITPNTLIEGLQNSNHPTAKQIRKDGTDVYIRYLQGETVNLKEDLGIQKQLPQTYAEALRELASTVEEKERLALENKEQKAKIKEDAPKVEAFDTFINSSNELISITDFSKLLQNKWPDIKPHKLFDILREAKILQSGYFTKNLPYQKFIDDGYFKVKEKPSTNSMGFTFVSRQTMITPAGQRFLWSKFLSARENDEDIDE